METFLGNVARSLYDEFGEDISSVRILLPNTRSRLFFLDELGRLIRRPVWQPRYTTVDEVMRSLAGYAPGERVRAVAELYKVYSRYHKEGFDSFYFWGEVLLNDFDQIDKYRVDADMLFSNLRDLKDMDGFRKDVENIHLMGFDGKSIINPRQIPIVHEIFTPTQKDIIFAEKVVKEIDSKKALGIGVFTVDGKMIDIAFYDGAKRTIDLAKASGVYKGDL